MLTDSDRKWICSVVHAAVDLALSTGTVSRREAVRKYGKTSIMMWEAAGYIHPRRNGEAKNSKVLYSSGELAAAERISKM